MLEKVMMMFVIALLAIATTVAGWKLFDDKEPATKKDLSSLRVEIVSTPQQMAKGLSGRKSIDPDQAMLFAWKDSAIRCMWGKDMLFDIDVGFMNEAGTVIGFSEIKAGDEKPTCSDAPARFAIEMKSGELKSRLE